MLYIEVVIVHTFLVRLVNIFIKMCLGAGSRRFDTFRLKLACGEVGKVAITQKCFYEINWNLQSWSKNWWIRRYTKFRDFFIRSYFIMNNREWRFFVPSLSQWPVNFQTHGEQKERQMVDVIWPRDIDPGLPNLHHKELLAGKPVPWFSVPNSYGSWDRRGTEYPPLFHLILSLSSWSI